MFHKFIKRIYNRIHYLSPLSKVLSTLTAVGIIVWNILYNIYHPTNPFVYVMYIFSFLALIYLMVVVIYLRYNIKRYLKYWVYFSYRRKKNVRKFIRSYSYRTIITSIFPTIFSISYGIFNTVLAVKTDSIWLGSIGVYYLILALTRSNNIYANYKISLIEDKKEKINQSLHLYRNNGFFLIILNISFGAAVYQMLYDKQGYPLIGYFIYIALFYTLYKIYRTIKHIVRAKNNHNFGVQCVRNLNFVDALVALVGLQTSMFISFGNGYDASIPNAITGFIVVFYIICMGIYMVIKSNRELKKLHSETPQ